MAAEGEKVAFGVELENEMTIENDNGNAYESEDRAKNDTWREAYAIGEDASDDERYKWGSADDEGDIVDERVLYSKILCCEV